MSHQRDNKRSKRFMFGDEEAEEDAEDDTLGMQALILAPTRELAIQVRVVYWSSRSDIGCHLSYSNRNGHAGCRACLFVHVSSETAHELP